MKHAEAKNEVSRAYNKTEKGRAAQKLRDAVRKGLVYRGACEICGENNAQGHHSDYSKPLEVRWLCPKHHKEEHLYEPWQNELRRAGYTGGFELGQLIEACGDRELNIIKKLSEIDHKYEWRAGVTWQDIDGFGSTPTEAVANLYLSLKKEQSK